jgi:hypothetical protein
VRQSCVVEEKEGSTRHYRARFRHASPTALQPSALCMRILKQKRVRRALAWYKVCYGLREPYKVLLDGNFIHACVTLKCVLPCGSALAKLPTRLSASRESLTERGHSLLAALASSHQARRRARAAEQAAGLHRASVCHTLRSRGAPLARPRLRRRGL